MTVRGIRGATTSSNDTESILSATRQLLLAIMQQNPTLRTEDIASVIFTTTADLQAVHPAKAARDLGWTEVPLMCALELDVPGGLSQCLRVLIHWNTELSQHEIHHVYLENAKKLRPDLCHE